MGAKVGKKKIDYYAVLGVKKGAEPEEIKRAYRKIAIDNHPDRFPNDAAKEEVFRLATEAFDVLGDPAKRRRYDQTSGVTLSRGTSTAVVDYFRKVFLVG